jgi:hypothetical protein
LATDGGALLAQDGGDAGFGDAVASADPLGGFAGFVVMDDVGDVFGGQEALRPEPDLKLFARALIEVAMEDAKEREDRSAACARRPAQGSRPQRVSA